MEIAGSVLLLLCGQADLPENYGERKKPMFYGTLQSREWSSDMACITFVCQMSYRSARSCFNGEFDGHKCSDAFHGNSRGYAKSVQVTSSTSFPRIPRLYEHFDHPILFKMRKNLHAAFSGKRSSHRTRKLRRLFRETEPWPRCTVRMCERRRLERTVCPNHSSTDRLGSREEACLSMCFALAPQKLSLGTHPWLQDSTVHPAGSILDRRKYISRGLKSTQVCIVTADKETSLTRLDAFQMKAGLNVINKVKYTSEGLFPFVITRDKNMQLSSHFQIVYDSA